MSGLAAWTAGAFDAGAFDAALFQTTISTTVGITLGGIDARQRMRKYGGPQIRDILNDSPNTCTFVVDEEAPAVGQRVRITINDGGIVLFAGRVQTVEHSFEGLPQHVVWRCSAIDDTAEANMKRPFGAWSATSASTIAAAITPAGFSTAGIEAGLPSVTITFDGSATFIACLSQLATAVGGYCKVEDLVVYLFLEDTTVPPDPIDADHPFLFDPPITITTDSSQLRTRVYGKGYGESIRADVASTETLLPIEDGVMFPALGGSLIVGRTPDGAQSDRITYTGVQARGIGTLVGPGAAPAGAPTLALQAGAGCDSGTHDFTVVFVTAAGRSLPGPLGSLIVGSISDPTVAAVAGTPLAGTGPDEGSHDYRVTFVALGGETNGSTASNSVTTSATVGQLTPPGALTPSAAVGTLEPGNLVDTTTYDYAVTFVNATGETNWTTHANVSPPGPPNSTGFVTITAVQAWPGGSMTEGVGYTYWVTGVCANGYETMLFMSPSITLGTGYNSVMVEAFPHPDARVTSRRIYRTKGNYLDPVGGVNGGGWLIATVDNALSGAIHLDTLADTALTGTTRMVSAGATGTSPGFRMSLSAIPVGAAGTTKRKIYRRPNTGDYKLVTTLNDNTTASYSDNVAEASLGAVAPTSNTTGSAVQKVPLSAIPIGASGTTARKIYRRFNGAGDYKLVTTLANNTATTYQDTTPNASLGAVMPAINTAVGNQVALSNIPIGAAAVTQREIYMSAKYGGGGPVLLAGGARKRALTIADNTTTTGTITMSDATLAGQLAEPTTDTSGLQQSSGQVNVGATTLPVASAATFLSTGGWVELGGGQVVRYTGKTGQTLTGIPESGAGSIMATIANGSTALPAPMLTGVSGIPATLLKGAAVHLWVQRDHYAAQAEEAARSGTDGIVEYLISDGRRGETSLIERCDADLAMFARPIITASYDTRDVKSKSGKAVTIYITQPEFYAVLTIQEVTISEIDYAPGVPPRFSVTASSVRFSLEDTLRQLIVKE